MATEKISAPNQGQRKKYINSKFKLGCVEGLLFILPLIMLILVFKGYPLVKGFILSFQRQEGLFGYVFTGLENYVAAFSDKIFIQCLINISKGVIAFLPIIVFVPFVISFFIHQKVLGWQFFRSTYLITYMMAPVVIGIIWKYILDLDGPINDFLKLIGLKTIALNWLGNPNIAMWTVFVVVFWAWFGIGTLIYLASMANINEELYEAARLDGANNFQIIIHITLYEIFPTMSYWTVICTCWLFLSLFPFIYSLTYGGPGYATMTPEIYIYILAVFLLKGPYAAALGILLFIILLFFTFIQVRQMFFLR